MSRRILIWQILLLGLACAPLPAAGPIQLNLQVASGDRLPGGGETSAFARVGVARHNDRNQVAFAARVGDSTVGLEPDGSPWGVFLKDESGIRKVLFEGDPLPGGAHARFDVARQPGFALNNAGEVAVIIPSQGIILDRQGQLQWLVQAGQDAPGTNAAFAAFDSLALTVAAPARPFFNDEGRIVLLADLSDASRGVFLAGEAGVVRVASSGQTVPGHEDLQFGTTFSIPTLRGNWVLFLADAGGRRGVFRYSQPTQLETAALQGDVLPDGLGSLTRPLEADINASGTIAFHVGLQPDERYAVLLGRPGDFAPVVRTGDVLPGFPGPGPRSFGSLSLDDHERLFFLAETITSANSTTAGFYLREAGGGLLKVAADGDAAPLGGTFLVGTPVEFEIPVPAPPRFYFTTRMNNSTAVAFEATLVDSEAGKKAMFVWRSGSLTPIPGVGSSPPGLGDRLIDGLQLESINESGSVLLSSFLCCSSLGSAVFLAEAAPAQERFLPFLTLGEGSGSLRHRSRIDLLNHSRFPAFAELEVFDQDGMSVEKIGRALQGGEALSLDLAHGFNQGTGYARLRIDGGAEIGMQGLIQLSDFRGVFSQTTVESEDSLTKAELIVEADDRADSGIALANLEESPADLEVRLSGPTGLPAFARTVSLDPRSQISLFVSELFPDLERPFIGCLEVESPTRFLAAGLRQAELQLSTLPIDEGRPARYQELGFANLFPTVNSLLENVLLGPQGQVAVFSRDGRIVLIDDEEPIAVLAENTLLPEVQALPNLGSGVRLLGFMRNGELVFSTPFRQQSPEGPVENEAFFRWKQGRLEKLFQPGDVLPDGTIAGDEAVLSPDGKLLLLGEGLSETTFFVLDGDALQKVHSENIQLPLRQLGFGNSGRIAYVVEEERLDLLSEDGKTTVARLGDVLGGRMRLEAFGSLELSPPNRLFFLAGGRRPDESGEFQTGLFLYDGQAVQPLLVTGDVLPGRSDAVVTELDLDFEGSGETYKVNASGAAVARANFAIGNVANGRALIFIGEDLEKRLIVPVPEEFSSASSLVATAGDPFDWNDSGRLLFQARPSNSFSSRREGLFVWQGGEPMRLLQAGTAVSADGDPLSVIRLIQNGWRIADGRVYFQALIAGEQTSGLYLAAVNNAQQHFVPYVVQGSFDPLDYKTDLLLRNAGEQAASVTVRLFNSEGRQGSAIGTLELSPGEVRSLALVSEEPLVGWARVDASGGSIQVVSRLSARRSGELFSQVTIPAVGPRLGGFWSGAGRLIAGMDGGIAVSNPYNAPIRVTIDSLDQGFVIQRQADVAIPAKGHRALLFSEIFAGQTFYSGFFRLRSDFPVPAASLLLNGLRISSQPVFHPADP